MFVCGLQAAFDVLQVAHGLAVFCKTLVSFSENEVNLKQQEKKWAELALHDFTKDLPAPAPRK